MSVTVQFCPCGHTNQWEDQDPKVLENLKRRNPKQIDAPTFHSSQCEECREEDRRQNALYAYYDL